MIEIHPPFRAWLRRHRLNTYDNVLGLLDAMPVRHSRESIVRALSLGSGEGAPGEVFLKVYRFKSSAWRYLGRHSKAVSEFRNYRAFQQFGIPCPQPVAVGERRDFIGRLQGAFIITQAVPGARTLAEYFSRPELARSSRSARRKRLAILTLLGQQTRLLHDASFYHHDLVWRNLLVSENPDGVPGISWIDCPSGSFSQIPFMKKRRRLRDLGSFDKSAARLCSPGERLAFYKAYSGEPGPLSMEAKQDIRRGLAHWHRQWPDDWTATTQSLNPAS